MPAAMLLSPFVVFMLLEAAFGALCPENCTATVDGSSFRCRYYDNNCVMNITWNASRVVDINLAIINPYVGGVGDMMTQVEPAIAMALQDLDASDFLPGYRLNAYLADSKCTVPDATSSTVAVMSASPTKHVVLGDCCSAACEAVNDALRYFNVLQVSPGCVSVSLSDSSRYPYYTRMAPSFRFNVLTLYELFKFLSFQRIGIVYGYRSINNLAKDLFLEMMANDNAAGSYSWYPLYSHRVEFLEDAAAAVAMAESKDSRINFMALYEVEGSMLLCQAYKRNMLTPDFNWFVASGWWNANYIMITANTAKSPCTVQELQRASYSLIASDRGPMLNTQAVHSLSGKRLSELYNEYTAGCESFANGKGVCNYQWAGYFYDGVWLIANALHGFLIDQNRTVAELATASSRAALEQLSLSTDFMGQTGRVRQFNSVDPTTTPPSYGDRDGIVLLRQATGPPESAFVQLALRSEAGFDFQTDIKWSSTDAAKMVSCTGASCNFATGWLPSDRASQCGPGEFWVITDGCDQCPVGSFISPGMAQCATCSPGQFSGTPGASVCTNCPAGSYMAASGASLCNSCREGTFMAEVGKTECQKCPVGSYSDTRGLSQCTTCPAQRETAFEGASSADMCICFTGERLEGGECVECAANEICVGGRLTGLRPSNDAWANTMNRAGKQRSLSQMMGKNFFSLALGVRFEHSLAELNDVKHEFDQTLNGMINGGEENLIQSPEQIVENELQETLRLWTPLKALLETKSLELVDTGVMSVNDVLDVADQTYALRAQSNVVVEAYQKAAASAGAELNGLQVSIAGRQRTLIQQICSEILLIALGANVPYYGPQLRETAALFQETEEALVFGIDAVGLPELRKMCSIHQMQEVNFYFRQIRPMVREIVNSPTPLASTSIAKRVALNVSSLTDPFFDAMVQAVELLINDTGACNPLATVTDGEWMALMNGIADARTEVAEAMRYYMQITNKLVVQASKVELSVLIARLSQVFNDLVQGRKATQLPAPLTQQMLEYFIDVLHAWETFAVGLDEGVRQNDIPEVDVLQQISIFNTLKDYLTGAMDQLAEAASGTDLHVSLLDLTHRQEMAFHNVPIMAYEVMFGARTMEELNATMRAFDELQHSLILGSPATAQRVELRQVADLCVIRLGAQGMALYEQIALSALQIASGMPEAAESMNQRSSEGIAAMAAYSEALYGYYQGTALSCGNVSYGLKDWELLMAELVHFAGLLMDVSAAYLRGNGHGMELELLSASMDALYKGSAQRNIPVQPTQGYLERIINALYPAFQAYETATQATGAYSNVRTQEDRVYDQSKNLMQSYTNEALLLQWPAQRVKVAMWQLVTAKRVYKEYMAERFDEVSDLRLAELEFETAHRSLQDGGEGFDGITDEELQAAWDRIDSFWIAFKATKEPTDLTELLKAIEASVPLFAIPSVQLEDSVPWFLYIILGTLGAFCMACCLAACLIVKRGNDKRSEGVRAAV